MDDEDDYVNKEVQLKYLKNWN